MSSTRSSATEPADFAAFMKQREEAAAAYVCGDPSPLDAIVPREGGATFFHPRGPFVVGGAEAGARCSRAHEIPGDRSVPPHREERLETRPPSRGPSGGGEEGSRARRL